MGTPVPRVLVHAVEFVRYVPLPKQRTGPRRAGEATHLPSEQSDKRRRVLLIGAEKLDSRKSERPGENW